MRYLNPRHWVGAIFDKELRVAGRRRRNCVLRFLYVFLFAAFVILVWLAEVPATNTGVVHASRMAEAGLSVILVIVWFQFIASQIIAVIMLSTAISDEIYHKTLGLLMTTPISSLQIVLGKLASRLLQIVLLLGLSLPLLAIVRVFGGIPWSFLLATFALTFTTAVFYGSLSLFHSIFCRRAYAVIIETILVALVLLALLPIALGLGFHDVVSPQRLEQVLLLVNPYVLMAELTGNLARPGALAGFWWPYHCLVSMGASVLLLVLSAFLVRKAALRQAVGQETSLFGRPRSGGVAEASTGRARRIVGPPVLWRERRVPLFGRSMATKIIAAGAVIGLFVLMYGLCAKERILDAKGTHVIIGILLTFLGLLTAVVLPATCVTSERESGAWPILMATPLRRRDILWGKALGVLQRCFLVWLLLLVHVTIFTIAGIIHPVALLQLALVAVGATLFLCGTGLYCSARFRRTTTAVVANLVLAGGLWLAVPAFALLCAGILHKSERTIWPFVDINPIVQTGVVTAATTGRSVNSPGRTPQDTYDWMRRGTRSINEATRWLALNLAIYTGLGLVFAQRAGARLRKDPCG